MGMPKAVLFLLLCILLNSVNSQSPSSYPYRHSLDDGGKIYVSWKLPEDEMGDRVITFMVEYQAKGCFGFGFSLDGKFPNSDIVGGWVKDDGTALFQDRHGDSAGMLIEDVSQDYTLINAYENDTHTIFEFSRKLDTCDKDDMKIDGSTIRVIFLYSQTDPPDNLLDGPIDPSGDISGFKSIVLLNYNYMGDLDRSSLLKWELRAPQITEISGKEAFIFCKIVKSPPVTEKHHIVHVEAIIDEGNEDLVYHLGLYECIGGTSDEYEDLSNDRGYECYTPDFPPAMFKCQGLLAAWGMKGGDMPLPKEAGLPIHPNEPQRYYMYEINYENIGKRTGIIDSSGFGLYYTSQLREHDAGNYVLCASILPRTVVPPGQNEYVVAGHTVPNCVSEKFPPTGSQAVASFVHARTLGNHITIRHFRDDQEYPHLVDDTNYDAHYQPFRYPPKAIKLLPNDQLTIECHYNSSQRKEATLNGMTAVDEICACVILYYPAVPNKFYSWSAATYNTINGELGTDMKNEGDAARIYKSYDWSTVDMPKFQQAMRYNKQMAQCYFGPFRDDINHTMVGYPENLKPYVTPSTCSAK